MQPKVSIIVPVYKAEKYLRRCIDSILAQSLSDFEVLLVDDGSPDQSGDICDEYAKKDSRVRVFHKINGGVSSARQCGIDNAKGEYTIHADPDDWVESNMLEELYRKAKEDDADMVICDYYINYEKTHNEIYVKQQPSKIESDTILKELFKQLHGSCCNKLIRRVCYKKYNVRFPFNLNCNEDQYVCASLLLHSLSVAYLPKAFYHYIQDINTNSLVRTPKSYDERLKVMTMFCSLLQNHKCYNYCYQFMVSDLVCNVFWNKSYTSKEFKDKMYKYRRIILSNTDIPIYFRLELYLSCIGLYSPIVNIRKILRRIIDSYAKN